MSYFSMKSLLCTLSLYCAFSCTQNSQLQATTVENYTEMALAGAAMVPDIAGHHFATKNNTKRAAALYILRDLLYILRDGVYFHNYSNLADQKSTLLGMRDGIANGAFLMHDLTKLYQDIQLFRGPKKSKPIFFEETIDPVEALAEMKKHKVSGAEYVWRVATVPVLKGLTAFAIALSQDRSRTYVCPEERYSAASAHSLARLLDEYTELETNSPHKNKLLALIIANAVWLAYEIKGYIAKRIEIAKAFGICTLCTNNGRITALSCGHSVCERQGCQNHRVALGCGHSACRECLAPRLAHALQNNDRTLHGCLHNGCHGRLNITDVRNITENNEQSINQFNALMHPIIEECGLCMDQGESSTLQCGHTYCRECLQDHIRIAIENRNLNGLSCPNQNCQHRLSVPDVVDITDNNQETLDHFNRAIIQLSPGTRQCPTSGCGAFFPNPQHVARDHACQNCNTHYCSRCLVQHPNNVVDCLEALRTADPQRENELAQNARRCSRCTTPIQRNGGCHHMRCSQCNNEFCYLCGGPNYGYRRGFCRSGYCINRGTGPGFILRN